MKVRLLGSLGTRKGRQRLTGLVLFLVAFVPRVTAAGAYVTVDEQRWIERSVDFAYNLLHGDLGAISSLHPGVTATWGYGSFLLGRFWLGGDVDALFQMRVEDHYPLPDLLPTAALFTALATSVSIVIGFWLLGKLFGARTAALASLLLALDPYLLAHSRRVHLDALLASTMYLAALALLTYLDSPEPRERRWLLLAGLFAGLAWLTKLPAIYLLPFALLAFGVHYLLSKRGRVLDGEVLRRFGFAFLIWLAVGCLVFYALWPSMWVRPAHVLSELSRVSTWGLGQAHRSADAAAAPMHFFLGKPVSDPGPGYYPLIVLFRLSPLVFALAPASVLVVVAAWRRPDRRPQLAANVGLIWAYIVFFVVTLTLGAKKLESYTVPIFPMIDVLAAVGLMGLLSQLAERWRTRSREARVHPSPSGLYAAAIGLALVVSPLWLRLAPYYSAYFNPLLGGEPVASRLFVYGGGQGLEMAAEYLNQKADAQDLVVSTAYHDSVFQYYFQGTAEPAGRKNWPGSWLLSDYVILYFSYAQRGLPSPEVVDYLEGLEPEYVASIGGTDYAKVYRVPELVLSELPAISYPAAVALGDQMTFLGYDLGASRVESGGQLEFVLYWRRQQQLHTDYAVRVRLVDGAGRSWGEQGTGPIWGMMPTSRWGEGMTIVDPRELQIPPDTPPGSYQIGISVYDPDSLRCLEPEGSAGQLLLGPVEVVQGPTGGLPGPQIRHEPSPDDEFDLLGG